MIFQLQHHFLAFMFFIFAQALKFKCQTLNRCREFFNLLAQFFNRLLS